jgi:hypothetical protein
VFLKLIRLNLLSLVIFQVVHDQGGFDHDVMFADKDKNEITILPKDKEDFIILCRKI